MRVYVASSWRNFLQPTVVEALRQDGHEVYDYRNPAPGEQGFHWSEISPKWQDWTAEEFERALGHPLATEGFARDFDALHWCDACILVQPCGRSAHLELGWAAGHGKRTAILLERERFEPELMYRMAEWLGPSIRELRAVVREWDQRFVGLPRQGEEASG